MNERIENKFPEVMPPQICEMVCSLSTILNTEPEVITTQLLTTLGFAMSNYQVTLTPQWKYRTNLWSATIIPSGGNKGGILAASFSPISHLNKRVNANYEQANEMWNLMKQAEKGKTEAIAKSINQIQTYDEYGNNLTSEPVLYEPYLENFTMPAMLMALSTKGNNGRPCIIRYDELAGLYLSLNGKGSDETDLNKLFDYDDYKKTRQDKTIKAYVPSKIVSMIGTTQKKMLFDIFTQTRIYNGNIFRYLFTIDNNEDVTNPLRNLTPENIKKYEDSINAYNALFSKFMTYESYMQDVITLNLNISADVINVTIKIRDELNDYYSDRDIAHYKSIMGKMDGYLFKFAMIINRLNAYYAGTLDKLELYPEDFLKAKELVKYYINNTFSIIEYVGNKTNQVTINAKETDIMSDLPATFSTSQFNEIYTAQMICSKSKAEKRLRIMIQSGLFKKNKQGEYYKVA